MNELEETLRSLCITRTYLGYHIALYLVTLIVENEDRLHAVVQELYVPAAKHFRTTKTAIDRNLRTIVDRAWQCNPERLSELAGYPLSGKPTPAEFLDILATQELRRNAKKGPPATEQTGLCV